MEDDDLGFAGEFGSACGIVSVNLFAINAVFLFLKVFGLVDWPMSVVFLPMMLAGLLVVIGSILVAILAYAGVI